ncbi:olfactory receptor 51G2-like [Ambystoma mexicanum]|uniref:olfactory receptor 51G2-like n=1 Tax=Ambystoma mexicanum TaxID=8296 RepID=UPI0037E7DF3A
MPTENFSNIDPPIFILMGFSGAETTDIWLSHLLSLFYLLSIVGNALILFILKTDNQLSEPMHMLLSMLAATDLGMAFATFPTVIGLFWFGSRRIHLYACLVQMFLIHWFCSMESAILVAMAFDRYVAICNPLRYASILHPIITKIGLVALFRGVSLHIALPFLINRLPYCNNRALAHVFCYHPDVMKLACADTTINNKYGMVIILIAYPVDSALILLSYILILKTVCSKAARDGSLKALNTCVSHLCVVLLFYIPLVGLTIAHRYGNATPIVLFLMGVVFIVIPPALNPIVYSIKTKKIRKAIYHRFWNT